MYELRKEKTDKRELIIETAQKRFGLYGIEKTSMREIANDLNMTKGSLYYYFSGKRKIYIMQLLRKNRMSSLLNLMKMKRMPQIIQII